MAGGDYCKARFTGRLFVFIALCSHFIFVHGRGLAIQKTKEIGMHEGTVKTIESEDGDVIDCVKINKQPAFNHPLLKDHKLQMKPTFLASGRSMETENNPMLFQSWHKNGECPEGTIPIRRTQEMDYPPRSYSSISKPNQTLDQVTRHEYAQVILNDDVFTGAHAYINVWQPTLAHKEEYTSAQIWLLADHDLDLNVIQAGWMVRGGGDQDYKPRLFIYWTSDGSQATGCYDLRCPGFVQIYPHIALGAALEPVSVYNGQQSEIEVIIRRDLESENWWLTIQDKEIGYWPSTIFTLLSTSAFTIAWGGEVINKNVQGIHTATQMGSGHLPTEGFGRASYFRNIGFYKHNGTFEDAKGVNPHATRDACYDVQISNDAPNFGTHFYFGGPGFSPDCL